jgi:hypothetical protein
LTKSALTLIIKSSLLEYQIIRRYYNNFVKIVLGKTLATLTEIKQQEKQKAADKVKLQRAVTGTATQFLVKDAIKKAGSAAAPYRVGAALSTVVDLISGVGIAAYSFLSQKKAAKKKEKRTKKQAAVQSYVDQVLAEINAAGQELMESGFNPLDPEFEQQLYNKLYAVNGYRGQCNANVWVPGSAPGANRQILFKSTKNGRVVTPVNMQESPYDLQTYWYSRCRGLKDQWVSSYQDLLISQGRSAELDELQSTMNKGRWIVRGAFGVILVFGAFFWFMNMRRIK